MTRRRPAVLAATLAALACAATAVGGATAAGAAAASCAPAGSRTLAAAGPARLYVRGQALYGCLGARRTLLGAAPTVHPLGSTRVALYALSPGFAGIDSVRMGVDTFASSVSIVDLRRGATVAAAPATTPENRAEAFMSATALAIDGHGTLAWIGSRSAVGAFTPVFEVHTLTATGSERLLASSTRIDPRSLRLRGRTLSWRQAGRTNSRTLAP